MKFWKRLLKMANVEDFTIHDTRHTLGTYAASESMLLANKVLGHSSMKSTNRYMHGMEDFMRDGVNVTAQKMMGTGMVIG